MSCASRTLKRSFRQFGGQAADREDKELTIIASIVLLFRACTVTARAMARGFVVSGAGASSHADADETTKQRPRSGLWQEFECKPPPFRDHRSRALRGGGNLLFRTAKSNEKNREHLHHLSNKRPQLEPTNSKLSLQLTSQI